MTHTGFAAQALLTPAGEDGTTTPDAAPAAAATGNIGSVQSDPLLHLALGMAKGLEAAGEGMARLGGWIRLRLLGPAVDAGEDADGKRRQRGRRAQHFLGSVFVVMVAVVVTVVLKRPSVLLRVFARR